MSVPPLVLSLFVAGQGAGASAELEEPTEPEEEEQEPPVDERVGQLPDVVVRPTRADVPHTAPSTQTSVITGEELRATGARSLPRQIGAAAGVWIQETNLGGGSAFVRGLTGNQLLILVDGVRLNDSTTRFGPNQSLNTIDPDIVKRVEVIRGPSSVRYGSDALGGVIAVYTKRRAAGPPYGGPVERGPAIELNTQYVPQVAGGRLQLGVSSTVPLGDDRHAGVYGSIAGHHYENLRVGGGDIAEETGYDGLDAFTSVDYELAPDRTLRYAYRLHEDDDVPRTDALVTGFPGEVGGPPLPPSDQQRNFATQRYQSHLLSFTDTSSHGALDRYQARLSFRRTDEERERQRSGEDELRLEDDEISTIGLSMDWAEALAEKHTLRFGFDTDHDDVDSSRSDVDLTTTIPQPANGAFAPGSEYTRFGAFVEDEVALTETLDMTAGLRYSRFDFEFDALSEPSPVLPDDDGGEGEIDALTGSLQLAADVSPGVRISGTLAQGFRAPNLSELAKIGSFGGGIELPNDDLEPEESLYGEVAVDVERGNESVGLAAYHHDISDVVGRRFDPDASAMLGEDAFFRENQGKVVVYGIEGRWRHDFDGSLEGVAFQLGAAWQRGRQYDDTVNPDTGEAPFDDVPFRRIPPLHGLARLEYLPLARPQGQLGLGLFDLASAELRFADEQDELSPGDISDDRIDPNGTAGWAIVNLGLEGPVGEGGERGRWHVTVENLFDHNYRIHGSGFDAPGFGIGLGLSLWW